MNQGARSEQERHKTRRARPKRCARRGKAKGRRKQAGIVPGTTGVVPERRRRTRSKDPNPALNKAFKPSKPGNSRYVQDIPPSSETKSRSYASQRERPNHQQKVVLQAARCETPNAAQADRMQRKVVRIAWHSKLGRNKATVSGHCNTRQRCTRP
jgi:hypothetical protein